MNRFAICIALLLVLAGCASVAPQPASPPVRAASAAEQRIVAEVLAGPIHFLADDGLEGRGPGTRGDRLARLYIAGTMESIGLRPGGPDGGWEQPFELVGLTAATPAWWTFARRGQRLRLKNQRDFVAVSGVQGARATVESAELVFVGYGIQAPEYQWDDFKGADLHGKVLLMLNNDPDWAPDLFAGKRRLYYGRWTYKYESAARQGAVAAIIIHTTESAGYPWQTVQSSWGGENSRLPSDRGPELQVQGWITEEAARGLVALGGHDLQALVTSARQRAFLPVPLGVTTSIRLRNHLRRYQTANVLGVLPGRDPALAEQFVVYTAHHDHLGVKKGNDGKPAVYNGAVDNAAGVAQLLAAARAFRALPLPPRRSVLFLAVAAEEQGLLGSAYYAAHPTVPAGRMVVNLNFDGANIWGRTRDVPAVGYGKSTLDAVAAAAAAQQGRTLVDEPFPERGLFYRSDQFNFAKIGVPALLLGVGVDFIGHPEGWGREQIETWIERHYHQPSDDFDPAWNLDGMVEDTRLYVAIGQAIGEAPGAPAWLQGDEFEPARQRALAALGN